MNTETVLKKAKRLAKESGMTYQQIGEAMGYPKESARQSVSRFLHVENPLLATVLRFAKAIGVKPRDLF